MISMNQQPHPAGHLSPQESRWYIPYLVFAKWVAISLIVGLCAGLVGVLFHLVLEWCTVTREGYPWLLWLLPLGGVVIAALYKYIGKDQDRGTNMVLAAVRSPQEVTAVTGPLIFLSTALTHLLGGSAGREGAALQLGGCIASQLGKVFRLDEKDAHVIVMCGTSAAFAALFGTPATAAIFALEVVSVGLMYYSAIVPCTLAALTGAWLAGQFSIPPTSFSLSAVPAIGPLSLLQIALLGLLCAWVSNLFCFAMHRATSLAKRWLPNALVRAAVGGALIILLTLLAGSRDYNGAGMEVIARAIGGQAVPWAFLLKILFTAVTLGFGFKGGEIVPVFFTGATFGCAAGALLGLDPGFAAALGLIAVFCGVTNCPVTSVILGVELFGAQGLLCFTACCAVSYMLSGYGGLYGEQKIVYSKLKAEFIDIKAR